MSVEEKIQSKIQELKDKVLQKKTELKDKDKALLTGLFLINDIVVIKNQIKLLKSLLETENYGA